MRAAAELHALNFFRLIAKDIFHARAHKGEVAGGIHHKDQVRETVDQTASKFLLLVEAALHLAALRNIHQRAVIANDAAASVAYRPRGIQADERLAVLAHQRNLAPLNHWLIIYLLAEDSPLGFIRKQIGEAARQQFFLGFVSEHTCQRRVDVDKTIVGRGDVDAFLQRFKELGKARFVLAQSGNVPRQDGDALDVIAAKHSVRYAVEIIDGIAALEANLDDAGPDATLEETRHGALCKLASVAGSLFDEFSQRTADNLRK